MSYPGWGKPRRRRSRRWHKRNAAIRRAAPVLMLLLALLGTATWLVVADIPISSGSPASAAQESSATPGQNLVIRAGEFQLSRRVRIARPVYRYSVVPGGVQTAEELREAALRDPEVARHYAGFRYEKARLVRLERAQRVYLSYRIQRQVYWTRTPHLIRAGETLITDGKIGARTRCANQISPAKQLPVSVEEPPDFTLEQTLPPVLPPEQVKLPFKSDSTPHSEPGQRAWVSPPWLLFPPPRLPIQIRHPHGGGCETPVKEQHEHALGIHDDESKEVPCPPRQPPHAVTPEPSTIVLFTSGSLALAFFLRYRQKKILPS